MLSSVLFFGMMLSSAVLLFAQSGAKATKSESAQIGSLEQFLNAQQETLFGITLSVPRDGWVWTKDPSKHPSGVALTLNNFDGKYIKGGIIPKGGAEISVVAAVVTSFPSVKDLIADHFEGDKGRREKILMLAGCKTTEVESELPLAPELAYKRQAVFLPVEYEKGSVLYKFLLSYNAADQGTDAARSFKTAFHNLLSSAILKAAPKRGCTA